MSKIVLPNGTEIRFVEHAGGVSDGYHSFDELYAHRCTLFAALCHQMEGSAWKSWLHDDGTKYEGWFVAGLELPTGQITYHLPESFWPKLKVKEVEKSLYDGHTSDDVIKRLLEWVEQT